MKTHKDLFARELDRLSGTYPNDERTSRINEKGFALIGCFYIFMLVFRILLMLASRILIELVHPIRWYGELSEAAHCGQLDLPVLAVMLLVILGIILKQRRRETPVQQKPQIRLRLADLPRTAAALFSGKSPEDERTVRAYERGFAVCALLGIVYFGVRFIFVSCLGRPISTVICLLAAPMLLTFVKMRENILTPPRFVHIRLSTEHILLRLPLYLLAVLPYLWFVTFLSATYEAIGMMPDVGPKTYSDSMFIMFFQYLGDGFREWTHSPLRISAESVYCAALIYLWVVILHETAVYLYRRQMKKMDAEENDLT